MARAVLHDEPFEEAMKAVHAVRQIRPDRVIADFGTGRIEAMMKVRFTPQASTNRRPAGWAEFRTLIHAMIKSGDGTSMPMCVWSQKEETAAARLRAEVEVCKELKAVAIQERVCATGAGRSSQHPSLCKSCRQGSEVSTEK